MTDKPTGPIWLDMTDALMDLPVRKLVLLANLAMNQLTERQIAEVCFEAGLEPVIKLLHTKENPDD